MLTAAGHGPASRLRLRAPGRERAAVAALALLAGLRVGCFAAGFPFFTNVDEHRHVDMVLHYAQGELPSQPELAYDAALPRLMARLGTTDYQLPPGATRATPPGWAVSQGELERRVAGNQRFFARLVDFEAFQSPTYYAVAGAWLAALRGLGVGDERGLYAVRLLNALFAALLVVCASRALRATHPDDALLRWGVPLLLACFPQDAFFYVTPDALSPLLGALAFAALLRLLLRPERPARDYAAAGLAAAAAFLTKLPNLYLPGVAAGAALAARGRAASLRGRYALYAAAFALPSGLWLLRTRWLAGDAFGTGWKVERLGWQHRPLSEWLEHPLLTPSGLASFLGGLVQRFWRGELVWRRHELAWPSADAVYVASTALCLALALAALWRRAPGPARSAELASAAALALCLAILVTLSLIFVFPPGGNPSAERPWFHHGRLIGGALLPFALLYVRGLRVLCGALPARASSPVAWGALGALCALALGSEISLSLPAFRSAHNLFHLP